MDLVQVLAYFERAPYYLFAFFFLFRFAESSRWFDGPASRGKLYPWKKDEDPALSTDSSPVSVMLSKLQFTALSYVARYISPLLFPPPLTDLNFYQTSTHPGVEGLVAVTVDDCFCRQDDPAKSLMDSYRELYKEKGHKATFFTTLDYAVGAWREKEIKSFLEEGHEIVNHCKMDVEYHELDIGEFEKHLVETNNWIEKVGGGVCKWFRAPSGKISKGMSDVLKKHKMKHVMLDCYGNDPHIPDANFIATTMLRSVASGSILIIHMPEKGFREWNFEALRLVLKGLDERGLKSVTLSELEKAAEGGKKTN